MCTFEGNKGCFPEHIFGCFLKTCCPLLTNDRKSRFPNTYAVLQITIHLLYKMKQEICVINININISTKFDQKI